MYVVDIYFIAIYNICLKSRCVDIRAYGRQMCLLSVNRTVGCDVTVFGQIFTVTYPNSKVHGHPWGPSGTDRIQVGPMLAP